MHRAACVPGHNIRHPHLAARAGRQPCALPSDAAGTGPCPPRRRGCGQFRLVQLVRLARRDNPAVVDDIINLNGYHGLCWHELPVLLRSLYERDVEVLPEAQRDAACFVMHSETGTVHPPVGEGSPVIIAGDFNVHAGAAIPLANGGPLLHRAANFGITCCQTDEPGGRRYSYDSIYISNAYRCVSGRALTPDRRTSDHMPVYAHLMPTET